jgi:outer membrane protein assembly factor BamB
VAPPLRLWLPLVMLTLFWGLSFAVGLLDKPYFLGFLYSLAAAGLLVLIVSGWWWANRRLRLRDRLLGFVLVLGGGLLVAPFCDPSVTFALLTFGLPLAMTTGILWMLLVKKTAFSWGRLGAVVVILLTWAIFPLYRVDGLNSDLKADVRWRWSSTEEEKFLVERAQSAKANSVSATDVAENAALTLRAGDWPAFRGPDRDGVLRGVSIPTNWSTSPRPRWHHRVGPAWSSMIVIGDRLYTQEQHGPMEAVVCYDSTDGKELWSHEDPARFWETVSGAGPRATPTFAAGRLYTLGGTGILNCLDAVTGKAFWTKDLKAEVDAPVPMWGFSSSPLVVDGLVIVFAGGKSERTLLAFRTEYGELEWAAPAGEGSYASPQLATLAGKRHCLMVSDGGLTAVDPANGKVLWKAGQVMSGAPRTAQPHLLGDTRLLVASLEGIGVAHLEVSQDGGEWNPRVLWVSTDLRPEFPDLVVHLGHAYGFDVNVFCCIDLANGKRCWRAGRYGRGQVLLLADQSLLLVLSETGEAVLLAASPDEHRVLGRFQALNGKTWNHPVIAHGRLYARNAEEMACYELTR